MVRTFTEDQSDERADYAEKASEFALKNGYTVGKPGKEEEPEANLGAADDTNKAKDAKPKTNKAKDAK